MQSRLRDFYLLAKPGIIYSNLLTAVGGFFLGSQQNFDAVALAGLMAGIALVIGSACVFNNYFDRFIDSKMQRTQKRATVSGTISHRAVLAFGTILGFGGFVTLFALTDIVTTLLGLVAFISYVFLYTPAKHHSPYATHIGTLPGALPPVAGYVAAGQSLDLVAGLLFLSLVCWQMPHFFAIALRRRQEYAAAKVPSWANHYGVRSTLRQMAYYAVGFLVSVVLLGIYGKAGWLFAVVMGAAGLYWLYICMRGFRRQDTENWALEMFLFSLLLLPLFSLLLIISPFVDQLFG